MAHQCRLKSCSSVRVKSHWSGETCLLSQGMISCTWSVGNWLAQEDPSRQLCSPTKLTRHINTCYPTTQQNSSHTIWTYTIWEESNSAQVTCNPQSSSWVMELISSWLESHLTNLLIWSPRTLTTLFWLVLWLLLLLVCWCWDIRPKRLSLLSHIGIEWLIVYMLRNLWIIIKFKFKKDFLVNKNHFKIKNTKKSNNLKKQKHSNKWSSFLKK